MKEATILETKEKRALTSASFTSSHTLGFSDSASTLPDTRLTSNYAIPTDKIVVVLFCVSSLAAPSFLLSARVTSDLVLRLQRIPHRQ